jgi:hypothetical protein
MKIWGMFASAVMRAGAMIVVGAYCVFLAESIPAHANGTATVRTAISTHYVIERAAVVDTSALPMPDLTRRKATTPLRMPDPVAYLRRKQAASTESAIVQAPSIQSTPALSTTAIASTSFAGMAAQGSCGGCEPPDTQVAAGPNHVFEVDNVAGRIFNKSGTLITSLDLNTFFHLNPKTLFSSDPRIRYDTFSNRWFASMLSLDNDTIGNAHNGQINLAVSMTSDPIQGFNVYVFPTAGTVPDQPGLGFNDDKVVVTAARFSCSPNCNSGPYEGNEFVVWDKAALIAGSKAIDTQLFTLPPGNSDSSIQPAKSRSSTPTLFMASASGTALEVFALTGVPGASAGVTAAATDMTIRNLAVPPAARQQGSSRLVDTGDSRIQDAVYRNGEFWIAGNSGCVPAGDSSLRACMRYIEVTTQNMAVNQDFDFGNSNAYDYYPAIDLDNAGNLLTAFTQSSASELPSGYINARLATDPADTLGTATLFRAGTSPYLGRRWGDYSGAGIDPADESSVWVAAEYSSSSATPNWETWIAQVHAGSGPPLPTPSPTPGSMHLSTTHLKFGNVPVNSSKSKTLVVKNTGEGDLHVSIEAIVQPFVVSQKQSSFTLHKSQSVDTAVTFAPTKKGKIVEQITVISDDPKNPSKVVTASGRGK